MTNSLFTGFLALSLLSPVNVVSAPEPPPIVSNLCITTPNLCIIAQNLPTVATSTPEGIKLRIKYYADLYGVSEVTMNIIVKNESRYNPKANGDGGLSHGLVQIYAPAHPNITHKQAHDVDWSLDFLAKNLKAGKCKMWSTCPTSFWKRTKDKIIR